MEENEDLEALMQEPPGGHNHGRQTREEGKPPSAAVSTEDMVASEFLSDDNTVAWSLVNTRRGTGPGGTQDAGMTSHRGVLHPDEHVNAEVLYRELERSLGISLQEFDAAYRSRGKPTTEIMATREKMDQVFLEVVEAGGNVEELAKILGVARARIFAAAKRARERRDDE